MQVSIHSSIRSIELGFFSCYSEIIQPASNPRGSIVTSFFHLFWMCLCSCLFVCVWEWITFYKRAYIHTHTRAYISVHRQWHMTKYNLHSHSHIDDFVGNSHLTMNVYWNKFAKRTKQQIPELSLNLTLPFPPPLTLFLSYDYSCKSDWQQRLQAL